MNLEDWLPEDIELIKRTGLNLEAEELELNTINATLEISGHMGLFKLKSIQEAIAAEKENISLIKKERRIAKNSWKDFIKHNPSSKINSINPKWVLFRNIKLGREITSGFSKVTNKNKLFNNYTYNSYYCMNKILRKIRSDVNHNVFYLGRKTSSDFKIERDGIMFSSLLNFDNIRKIPRDYFSSTSLSLALSRVRVSNTSSAAPDLFYISFPNYVLRLAKAYVISGPHSYPFSLKEDGTYMNLREIIADYTYLLHKVILIPAQKPDSGQAIAKGYNVASEIQSIKTKITEPSAVSSINFFK